jgi:hypothetical protein
MKKITAIFIGFLLLFSLKVKADEGMWLLPLLEKLNMEQMQSMGLELTSEQIYSINNSSLKDAIVRFGGGCTGEIISEKGLVLTNHHCGYGVIQRHSSVENDYLTNGFWAKSFKEEIPSPGLSVTFLLSIDDVTERIVSQLEDKMSETERLDKIRTLIREIESEVETNQFQVARVHTYYGGNQFYLIVYEIFRDVRFVGAPPSSIGKFGADTDNWMWPRQTGDFALFRVYTDVDGKPAEYSADNIPMKPKHYLPISNKGVQEGDFAMILGYPGSTSRYMTSSEVQQVMDITNSNRIRIRGIRQEILLEDMLASDKVRIQYASKYSGSTNYWKYSIGQNRGLQRLNVIDKKLEQEKAFRNWFNTSDILKNKYSEALDLIESSVKGRAPYLNASQYINESLRNGEIFRMAGNAENLYTLLQEKNPDQKKLDEAIEQLKNSASGFYRNYNASTDQKVVAALTELFYNDIDKSFHPDFLADVHKKFKGDFEKYSADLFKKSVFISEEALNSFLNKPSAKVLAKDPAFIASRSINVSFRELMNKMNSFNLDLQRGQRLFIAGLIEMHPERVFYPDANSTMRLTYGTVASYQPADAVHYNYVTTMKGIIEKEDPDNWEFVVPKELKDLYNNKDFGPYAKNGEMIVNFISSNDITGGNSGSPVINGKGELIGLAFDGNWEAMSGDIAFENEIQRSISVDARYILFIIDKFAGATNLIEELTIVN